MYKTAPTIRFSVLESNYVKKTATAREGVADFDVASGGTDYLNMSSESDPTTISSPRAMW
jgi:hypothetical protein